ncbi:MAG: xanthine dehydrogenase family protein molybdopterin-binding subunit [Chloroflexi bacterium]|nr:xanthine dehydrogenase family protein molybdopterin-binding subunit [Chloroflexota bacterium]
MQARQYRVIGKPLPKANATDFVTGRAIYGADVVLPGMLHARVLRSPYAHAHIRRIDASKALALEGVKAVITGRDFPRVKPGATFPLGENAIGLDGVLALAMARDKALFHGHAVAAVAATDPFIAQEALELIEVEYEEIPPVLTLDRAVQEGAPLVEPGRLTGDELGAVVGARPSNIAMRAERERGDVAKGLAEADVVVDETYEIGSAHQGYIEPQACVARVEPDGKVTVWTTTQGSFTVKMQLAGLFGLPLSQVRVIPTEVGGAFGGKIYCVVEPLAVLLAQRTGRPVKLVLTREEVFRSTGPGAAARFRVRAGARRNGAMTALQIELWMAAGCVAGAPVVPALNLAGALYGKVPHMQLVGYDVLTNTPRVHAYRAPGAPQVFYALEQAVDALARAVGMDPIEFRLKNASEEGDPQASGHPFGSIGMKEVLRKVKGSEHWNTPLEGAHRGRGLAVGYWFGAQFTSSGAITVNPDGSAHVVVGSVDLTGTRTAFKQIVAEELGLSPEEVTVSQGDTETSGYTDVSGGSRVTYTMGAALYTACQDIIAQLKERAARKFGVPKSAIAYADGKCWVQDNPRQAAGLKDLALGPEGALVGRGSVSRMKPCPVFSAGVADVEVDQETGKVRLLRYTSYQDVGKAINPQRVETQMQGGAAQGIGWAMNEEYHYDGKGVLLNATFLDYRQPVALDMPFLGTEMVEVPAPDGPYGVRGVGEAPIAHPPGAIANALFSAAGVRFRRAPMTSQRVMETLRHAGQQTRESAAR